MGHFNSSLYGFLKWPIFMYSVDQLYLPWHEMLHTFRRRGNWLSIIITGTDCCQVFSSLCSVILTNRLCTCFACLSVCLSVCLSPRLYISHAVLQPSAINLLSESVDLVDDSDLEEGDDDIMVTGVSSASASVSTAGLAVSSHLGTCLSVCSVFVWN